MSSQNNKNKTRIAIPMLVLAAFLFFSYPQKTQAALWPGIDPNIKRMLDTIYDTVKGIILGAAKQAAVKMLNNQIDNLMGGKGSGDAAFITDWSDYLVSQPKDTAKVYMNDALSQMLGGRGSSSMYSSEGFSGTGDYSNYLSQIAKDYISDSLPEMTYEGDPSEMFSDGNFKNMSEYLSGVNNPWAFKASVENQYKQMLSEQTLLSQTKSIAYQGFMGTSSGDGGMITYPGILTKEMVANVENIPNNVIANANNIPEVITAIASKLITQVIQQGFSSVQEKSQDKSSTQNKLDSGIDESVEENGPGTLYDSSSSGSAWVNPDIKRP